MGKPFQNLTRRKAPLTSSLLLGVAAVIAFSGISTRADAQPAVTTVRMPPNYMLMTGHIRANEDAVYVLDVNSRILAAWEFNQTAKRLQRIRLMRDLSKDFPRGR